MENFANYNNSSRFPFLREMDANASPERMQIESPLIGRGDYFNCQQLQNRYYSQYNIADNLENIDPRLFCYLTSRDGYHTPPGTGMFHPTLPNWSSSSDGLSSRGTLEKKSLSSGSSSVFGGTPVKVKDEVLVMDGILVPSGKCKSSSGESSSSSSGKSTHWRGCHSWEVSGTCSYGSKCHFLHGRQGQSQIQSPFRPPLEVKVDSSHVSASMSPKSYITYPIMATATSKRTPQSASSIGEPAASSKAALATPKAMLQSVPSITTPASTTKTASAPSKVTPQSTSSVMTSPWPAKTASATPKVTPQSASSIAASTASNKTCPSVLSTSTPPTALTVYQSTSFTKTPNAVSQFALSFTTEETASVTVSESIAQMVLTGRHIYTKTGPVYADWCPQDDGIDVLLSSSIKNPASREDLQAYIHDALSACIQGKKRLPVFDEICSD